MDWPFYNSSEKKILIVGDSHYCNECDRCGVRGDCSIQEMGDCVNLTQAITKKYIGCLSGNSDEWEAWMSARYKFDKIMFGKSDVSMEERIKLWNSICFYNFVQTATASSTRNTEFTDEDYAKSSEMFLPLLEELQPEYVIVWGRRAYNALPSERWTKGDSQDMGYYTLGNGLITKCMYLHNPSWAGFEEWSQKVAAFIQ